MSLIKSLLEGLFKPSTYGTDLEQYICAHNPSSVADVEYWTNQYDRKQWSNRGLLSSYPFFPLSR